MLAALSSLMKEHQAAKQAATGDGCVQGVSRRVGIIEEEKHIDGLVYKVTKCGNLYTGNITIPLGKGDKNWIVKARTESDLPLEIVEKYKDTCIPDEELFSILGDKFTLYQGFVRESSPNTGIMEILAESFESLNRGGLMVEYIDVFKGKLLQSRMVRFKWNGIVVHEEVSQENIKKTNIKGRLALISKLSRKFYTVKAKKSFFNKGLPPQCQDVNKLNEVLRVVKKTDLPETPTIADVKKFIDDFFQENAHLELVFTPDSTHKDFMEPIKKYGADKGLGLRFFRSSPHERQGDNVVLFVKRSPAEVRERLKELPGQQDLRFFLIPPCEQCKTYQEYEDWCGKWMNKVHVPDECNAGSASPQNKRKSEGGESMQSELKKQRTEDEYGQ